MANVLTVTYTDPVAGNVTVSSIDNLLASVLQTNTFAATVSSAITRSANTTTYTVNTGWNNGTPAYFSWAAVGMTNGENIQILGVDIYSSANPTLKLQGNIWLFSAAPGTIIADNATFTIASADYANLTASSFSGIPFTLTNNQASGASNSGISLTPAPLVIKLGAASTTLYGMVQVTNAYIPASAEVLTIILHTQALN